MIVTVKRRWFSEKATLSDVLIDNSWEAYGLEDRIRGPGVKVKGATAIPAGLYPLVVDFSNRFQKQMPHVLNVPMFDGIRIHAGNTEADTEGCLLLGAARDGKRLINSRFAFEVFFGKLRKALTMGPCSIEYINVDPPAHLLEAPVV